MDSKLFFRAVGFLAAWLLTLGYPVAMAVGPKPYDRYWAFLAIGVCSGIVVLCVVGSASVTFTPHKRRAWLFLWGCVVVFLSGLILTSALALLGREVGPRLRMLSALAFMCWWLAESFLDIPRVVVWILGRHRSAHVS